MRLCRQPTEAPPVRSMVIDNIAAKSESGMKPEEVRDREQRKQTWQALSETALNGWKAMFAKPKRQRAEPAPYPAYMYGGLMVRRSLLLPARCEWLLSVRAAIPFPTVCPCSASGIAFTGAGKGNSNFDGSRCLAGKRWAHARSSSLANLGR